MRSVLHPVSIGLLLVVLIVATVSVARSQPPTERVLSQSCRDVLVEFDVLRAEIIELDQALICEVERMRAAPADTEFRATQAVVEMLVDQRPVVRDKLKMAHQLLTVHIVEHMAAGPDAMPGSCPALAYMNRDAHRSGSPTGDDGPLDR